VGGRAEAIEKAKLEIMHEVETREHWPVLDAAIEKLCAQMSAPRRQYDPSSADFSSRRGSRNTADPVDAPVIDRSLQDIITGWRFSKWILGIIFVAVVGWGLPFWADSCAQRVTHEPAPTVTVTPTDNL
jgi:hypothetical protein